MNGILDKQTSDNDWQPPVRAMLHERLQSDFSPTPSRQKAQDLVIDELERQMSEHNAEFAGMLDRLKHLFIFTNAEAVENFLRSYRALAPILIDAEPFFREAFNKTPLALDVMNEEGAARTIYALALWRGEREKARAALRTFDEKWWLDNMRKTSGKIVFD